MKHEHEAWQLRESATGDMYCAACGESVVGGREMSANDDAVIRHLNAHYRPDVAADLLAAGQPLMAIAWDEGLAMGWGAARGEPEEPNPYRAGAGE